MTREEFFNDLATIPGWTISRSGLIRTRTYSVNHREMCPILAVARKQGLTQFQASVDFRAAATCLGLNTLDTNAIVDAADNNNWAEELGLPNLRQQMLNLLKLQENR